MNELSILKGIGTADAAAGFTGREFMRIVETGVFDGCQVELEDGVIIKMAPAGMEHAARNATIVVSLTAALQALPLTVATDLAVEIDERTLRGIDIAVVGPDAPQSGPVRGVDVQLAVEIASTTLIKDLGRKGAEYAEAQIPIYWVVDVNAKVVHVLSMPVGVEYTMRTITRFGEPLGVPGSDAMIEIK